MNKRTTTNQTNREMTWAESASLVTYAANRAAIAADYRRPVMTNGAGAR